MMIKGVNFKVNYESKSRKGFIKSVDNQAISKALNAIKEGKKIRETEESKFYGVACGC